MKYLVATDSVHTTAAACDYLGDRADPDDEVLVLAVEEGGNRDAADAVNVATVRLVEPAVEPLRREGTPADEILAAATDHEVDEIVIGARGGAPGSEPGVGSTARQVLADATVPVVVVPLPDLD